MKVTAVAAPGVLAGSRTGREVFEAALAVRGLAGDLVLTSGPQEFAAAVRAAAADGEFLLLPGDDTPADELLARVQAPAGTTVVRVDLDAREPDPSRSVRRHIRWRGMEGLRFAVDDWHFHRTAPGTRYAYGDHPDQYAFLHLPTGEGPFPVAVLVHGGYWRSRWENDLSHATAVDLTARGFAVWNVEYRRPDRHDWTATTADVEAAFEALGRVDAPLDLDRVVTLGHSAGGQLVVRLAADRVSASLRPALTVSLAGCLDLHSVHARGLSEHAVAAALGGTPEELPEVYAASSPLSRLPIGLPVAVVCCRGDDPDLLDASRRFADAARAAGDDVAVLEDEGHHFSVIDPASGVWPRIVALLDGVRR
ncbi:alpha/beta hydrolase family protein [Kineococcus sp. SYSU DK003]|uniref:alpha/beta hydrolase family protein n=1 Tax=Kineococcus sp. SYSU DK003 TaxID=3383124 RepID=UPI003D7DF8E4